MSYLDGYDNGGDVVMAYPVDPFSSSSPSPHADISNMYEVSQSRELINLQNINNCPCTAGNNCDLSRNDKNSSPPKENIAPVFLMDHANSSLFSQQISESSEVVIKKEGLDSRHNNYVYQILMGSGEGEFLIKTYDFEENPKNRKRLLEKKNQTYFSIHKVSRIILFHEIQRTANYSITSDRFEALAISASELFPVYLKDSFYSRASNLNNAHGSFQNVYIRLREKAIAMDFIHKSKGCKRKYVEEGVSYSKELNELKRAVNIIDDEFKTKWSTEVSMEEKLHWYNKLDYKTIFQDFPCFSHPLGYKLIQADFYTAFKTTENIFKENWPSIAEKVIKLARQKKKDKEIREILKDNVTTKENSEIVALLLLPFLFKKITKLTKRSKTGKALNPEKIEVLNCFIYHLTKTNDTGNSLKEIYEKLDVLHTEHKLIVAPFIVIIGPTLKEISAAYVVMDSHTYQVSNILDAVNLCFQCVKVFKKTFSHISSHVWQFLEREAFQFNTSNVYSSVSDVINKLAQMK